MTDSTSTKIDFPKLGEDNYITWSGNMKALLMQKRVWLIVKGTRIKPTNDKPSEQLIFDDDSNAAAGLLYLALLPSQQILVRDFMEDPVKMWKTLEDHHLQKKPSSRFTAYESLFNIVKEDNESLPALCGRVEAAMHTVRNLRPSDFTVQNLEDELACMTLIRALPAEQFAAFRSTLLLQPTITLEVLRNAFQLEEENRRPSASAMALAATTSASANRAVPSLCAFCKMPGHQQSNCFSYQRQKTGRNMRRRNKGNGSGQGNSSAHQAEEYAGNASTTPSPETSSDSWNADTGATSHMTPHRHWFKTYTPFSTPVRLANGQLVYSAGVGSVQFEPVINGKKGRLIEFERVLHVPALHSNLLSVLYLTSKKGWAVTIFSNKIYFRLHKQLHFTATVTEKMQETDVY